MFLRELCLLLACSFIRLVSAQLRDILNMEEGQIAIFRCVLGDNNYTLPEWRSLSSMVIFNQNSSTINQNLPVDFRNRLSQSQNQRDLVLSDVRVSDTGDYQCSHVEKGNLTITLSVSRTPGHSFPWWGILLIIMFGLYIGGIGIGAAKYIREKKVKTGSVLKCVSTDKTDGTIHDTVRFVFTLTQDKEVKWFFKSDYSRIQHSLKHVIEKDGLARILKIRNIDKRDGGTYRVEAGSDFKEVKLEVDEETWEVYLHKHTKFGFGIDIDETGRISEVIPGSPADRSLKIESGDKILMILKIGLNDECYDESLPNNNMITYLENETCQHVKLQLQQERKSDWRQDPDDPQDRIE